MAKKLKLRFYRASVKEDLNVTEGRRHDRGGVCPVLHYISLLLLHAVSNPSLFNFLISLRCGGFFVCVFPFYFVNNAELRYLEVPVFFGFLGPTDCQ